MNWGEELKQAYKFSFFPTRGKRGNKERVSMSKRSTANTRPQPSQPASHPSINRHPQERGVFVFPKMLQRTTAGRYFVVRSSNSRPLAHTVENFHRWSDDNSRSIGSHRATQHDRQERGDLTKPLNDDGQRLPPQQIKAIQTCWLLFCVLSTHVDRNDDGCGMHRGNVAGRA